jgi:hypothetical protein
VRLRITTRLHELDEVHLACLKLSIGQPSAKEFMPEPYPIGIENVALAVLSDLPDVTVTVVLFDLCASRASGVNEKPR